jgi:hypothetical protein
LKKYTIKGYALDNVRLANCDLSNLPPAAAKLPWTHNSILVEHIENPYISIIWIVRKVTRM